MSVASTTQTQYRYSFAAQYASDKGGIRTKFLAQGKSLQDVVESWGMETSDLFDLGVRAYFDDAEITLNGFYNIHHNLLQSAKSYSGSCGEFLREILSLFIKLFFKLSKLIF